MTDENATGSEPKQDEMTLEESFTKLDDLLGKMEQQGVSLEDSFRLYEQGMGLVSQMKKRLNELEGRVEKISADGQTEEFNDAI